MTSGHIFGYRPGSIHPQTFLGTILSILPTFASLLCFLLPGKTILKSKDIDQHIVLTVNVVKRQTSTREVPLLPFLTMMLQSLIWLIFGILKSSPAVILPNAVGFVLGSIYTYFYDVYAIDKRKNLWMFSYSIFVLIVIGAIVVLLPNSNETTAILGGLGAFSSVCFMASPLVAIVRVSAEVVLTLWYYLIW